MTPSLTTLDSSQEYMESREVDSITNHNRHSSRIYGKHRGLRTPITNYTKHLSSMCNKQRGLTTSLVILDSFQECMESKEVATIVNSNRHRPRICCKHQRFDFITNCTRHLSRMYSKQRFDPIINSARHRSMMRFNFLPNSIEHQSRVYTKQRVASITNTIEYCSKLYSKRKFDSSVNAISFRYRMGCFSSKRECINSPIDPGLQIVYEDFPPFTKKKRKLLAFIRF